MEKARQQQQQQEVARTMLDKRRIGTFVLGGVAGALAGILFAPRSGKEMRGSIANRAGEARERGRESYFEAQERMQERIAGAREGGGPWREGREETAETLPKLGATAPEPTLEEYEPSMGTPPVTPPDPPPAAPPILRDASRDAPPPEPAAEDPEEIRRRIQETRSRLRARLRPEPSEDRDA